MARSALVALVLATTIGAVVAQAPAARAAVAPVSGLYQAAVPGNASFPTDQLLVSPTVTWVFNGDRQGFYASGTGPSGSSIVSFHVASGQTLTTGVYEGLMPGVAVSSQPTMWVGALVGGGGGRVLVDEVTFTGDVITSLAVRFEIFLPDNGAPIDSDTANAHAAFVWNSSLLHTRTVGAAGSFGSVSIGNTTIPQLIPVTNTGDQPITVSSNDITGAAASEFLITSSCAGQVILPGATCSIGVTILPTGIPGPRTAYLRIFDDVAPPGGNGRRVTLTGNAVNPPSPFGEYTAVTPSRLLDTRDGTGQSGIGPIAPGGTRSLLVSGRGGIPSAGVVAVVLNVTVDAPTANGYLTVWPTDSPRPTVSSLNFRPGQTVPNLVTIKLGFAGMIDIFNSFGSTHVIADVVGYYSSGAFAGSRYHGAQPLRVMDSRYGLGTDYNRIRLPGETTVLDLKAQYAPVANATAVVLNVTVTGTTAPGYLTVYPADVARPLASNLNFVAGTTRANLVTVRLPADKKVAFFNSNGFSHILADVVGYYDDDRSTDGGRFIPIQPVRAVDTRLIPYKLSSGEGALILPSGTGKIPLEGASSVLINLTATEPTAGAYLSVFSADVSDLPLVSALNFEPGDTVPNAAIVALSTSTTYVPFKGAFWVYNSYGQTHVIVDAFGYFT